MCIAIYISLALMGLVAYGMYKSKGLMTYTLWDKRMEELAKKSKERINDAQAV